MKNPRFAVVLTLAIIVAAAALACRGGDADDAPAPTATSSVTGTGGNETAEPTAPRRTETPRSKQTRTAAAPTPTSKYGLQSFHYQVDISFVPEGEDTTIVGAIEGDFRAPDSHRYAQDFDIGSISGTEETIIIGEDAWTRQGSRKWKQVLAADVDSDLTSADPDFIADADFANDIAALDGEDSDVDGRPATKYTFDLDQLEAISTLFGEGFLDTDDLESIEDFMMVIWLDEQEDVILRAELEAVATAAAFGDTGLELAPDQLVTITLTLHLSDVNADVTIEPPI